MDIDRRKTTAALALALTGAGWTRTAGAQEAWPARPITFMVPQAAGGSTDTLAREIGLRLGEALGQSVVVDNKPGANGIIGCDIVAKSKPDGYMLLIGGTGTMAINQHMYAKMPFDPATAFVPVAMFGYSTSVLVVHPSVPVKTIGELITLIKSRPGAINYASAGIGSSPHLTAEMFRQMAGVSITHVPYKGSTPGVVATMAGETQMMFTGVASAVAQIKSGKLKALSISGPKRSNALPGVPTASESGLPGFEADFWIGLFAPAGTPPAIVQRLNAEVVKILNSGPVKEKFATSGVDGMAITPEAFNQIQAKDIERWAKIVKTAGLKGE
ncbi:Bug family tripartite tricarboxylate transporter substrate binding protein [Ramlibacter sp.]|uniref:Bug family tripartite tricarboxylate transporter substrate binding protein n=1 Tax=Ramlibacter sp. TaxID=1917967 RepID=UPI003D122AB5